MLSNVLYLHNWWPTKTSVWGTTEVLVQGFSQSQVQDSAFFGVPHRSAVAGLIQDTTGAKFQVNKKAQLKEHTYNQYLTVRVVKKK